MKIFDYTEGCKGSEIGERRLISWTSAREHHGRYLQLKVNRPSTEEWEFPSEAGPGGKGADGKEITYTPDDFGVEAICFCTGLLRCGTDEAWHWTVIGTDAWVEKAVKNGWLY